MTSVFIGIAGASASGKSLLAKTLQHEVGDQIVSVIKEDSYYRDQSHMSFEDREKTNYDHPNAFDRDLLLEHLETLSQGRAIDMPTYDYSNHNRAQETQRLAPAPVVILEGILILNDARLRQRLNLSVFMDTALDICLIRRLKRDIEQRGRSVDSVIEQYKKTVRPMYWQFIEPSREHADVIVPRGGRNRPAIDMIKARIGQILNTPSNG